MSRNLKVNENVMNWYENGGKEKIAEHFVDVDGIFTTNNGTKAGVYGAFVLTPEGKEIPMYIGQTGLQGRGFIDRLTEHANYWIENSDFYTGVRASELKNGYKYLIRILKEEADEDKRLELEKIFIEELKPYIQFNCYPKYKTEYTGWDLAIFPTYRRRAFVVARDGKYTEESFVENIYGIENVDFNEFRKAVPDERIVELIEKEMPNGSDIHLKIKAFVEKKLGIVSKRGCRYSYLVKIIASALEPVYKLQFEA